MPEVRVAGAPSWRRILVLSLVGIAVGAFFIVGDLLTTDLPSPDQSGAVGYVYATSPPRTHFDVELNKGDGQAFLALGQDPTLSHPEAFIEGRPSAALFAQRPLTGYLVWITSFGQPGLIPYSFTILSILAVGAFIGAFAWFAQARYGGRADQYSLAALVLPGAITGAFYGPNIICFAFGFAGLALWDRGSKRAHSWAAVCFVLGGLTRETLLLFPLALGIMAIVRRVLTRRDALLLFAGPVVYAMWLAIVRTRFGAAEGFSAINFKPPFVGLLESVGSWDAVSWANAIGLVAAIVVVFVVGRDPDLRWHTALWTALGLVLGVALWPNWRYFARILLPIYLFAILAVLSRLPADERVSDAEPVSP